MLQVNLRQVQPQTALVPVPDGWYKVVIRKSNIKATAKNDGSYLELQHEVIEGPHQGRTIYWNLNLFNPSQQAVEIAYKQLSAIGHCIGVYDVQDQQVPDSVTPMLHNHPYYIWVVTPANSNLSNVRGCKDINGNDPGKQGQGAAPMQPQQGYAAPGGGGMAQPGYGGPAPGGGFTQPGQPMGGPAQPANPGAQPWQGGAPGGAPQGGQPGGQAWQAGTNTNPAGPATWQGGGAPAGNPGPGPGGQTWQGGAPAGGPAPGGQPAGNWQQGGPVNPGAPPPGGATWQGGPATNPGAPQGNPAGNWQQGAPPQGGQAGGPWSR